MGKDGVGHRWQAQGPQAEPSLAPCFYLAAALSSLLLVKEQLHLYSPKSTFGPSKATVRLMWPLVRMSLTPLIWWGAGTKAGRKTRERKEMKVCYKSGLSELSGRLE